MAGTKRRIIVGAAAGLAVAGGGAAIAATQFGDPKAESQAVVDDAARQLGIQPDKLSAALEKALENRVDAAVAAGRLTKEQGDALKARIESGDFPIFGGPRGGFEHGPFGHHLGDLDVAAAYLGLGEAQLRTQLASGKSLADVARAQGKSVGGLVDVLVAAVKTQIDAAVAAGRLTQAQADRVLSDVRQRVTDRVNATPGRFGRHFRGEGFGFGPPAFDDAA
jgi:polyhydroxyalkanoate synthesis regulator phasin